MGDESAGIQLTHIFDCETFAERAQQTTEKPESGRRR
jgi:hypothetical protein